MTAVQDGTPPFRFRYDSSRLQLPADAAPLANAHAFAFVEDDRHLFLAYEPSLKRERTPKALSCLVRWDLDASSASIVPVPSSICAGVPHGLRYVKANGDEAASLYLVTTGSGRVGMLYKLTLNGRLQWSTKAPSAKEYQPSVPTAIAAPPDHPFVYMADGYGTSFVHAFHKINGSYAGYSFGGGGRTISPKGKPPRAPPSGLFNSAHGLAWDSRREQLLVTDRGKNGHHHHHHYYDVAVMRRGSPNVTRAASFVIPGLPQPCSLNVAPDGKHAVVASLDGPVGIIDASNQLVSKIDVGKLLGGSSATSLHPHDALLLPTGDLVVAAWNPGNLSYWRRLS